MITRCGAHGLAAMPSVSSAGVRSACVAWRTPAPVTSMAVSTATAAAMKRTALLETFVAACPVREIWFFCSGILTAARPRGLSEACVLTPPPP